MTTQAAFDIDQELTGATTIIAPSPRSLPRINLEVAEPIDQARAVQLLEEAIKQQAGIPIVHVSTVAEAMAKCLENNACALALHLSDADYPTNSDTSAALTWNFRTIPLQPLIEIYKNLAGPHKSRNECGACLG